ncbi:hypothetical protein COLO4_29475, partial [Corchorus olitorius]
MTCVEEDLFFMGTTIGSEARGEFASIIGSVAIGVAVSVEVVSIYGKSVSYGSIEKFKVFEFNDDVDKE